VFFKLELLKFSVTWGVVSFYVGGRFLLIFLPYTIDSHVVRSTIQIIPKLTQPTILTKVLVTPNQPVKKGDPLYRFDETIYSLARDGARAQLGTAQQNAKMLD
jgi:multidrug resistance efflux pump